jgi:hypothetical protein
VYLVVASRAPQFDYGRYRDQVLKSQAVLDREPCDRGAEASHLLKQQPWNPTYLWWRGQVYGEKGDW